MRIEPSSTVSHNVLWRKLRRRYFVDRFTLLGGSLRRIRRSHENLASLEFDIGGGGVYPFLYFLTRLLKPKCIVETGVAAGFSSSAFLTAIKANGRGRLYSSDFPYFRIANPEKYIGIVVEESLKANWELYIEGDESNLPKILKQVSTIDIFHYDSDKSYSGRSYAMQMVESKISETGIILMDDIEDNSHFHDYIKRKNISAWRVFEFQGKYVGMIGDIAHAEMENHGPDNSDIKTGQP